jgi:hypothetical protein
MPRPASGPPLRTADLYLLLAHEPYYPGPETREVNTTVAADSLLHPQVRQPDATRIHHLLTQGRQPGQTIPLPTLTHELNGGADWPTAGDWEHVTNDLLHLVRAGDCDAISLGLPEIARSRLHRPTQPGTRLRRRSRRLHPLRARGTRRRTDRDRRAPCGPRDRAALMAGRQPPSLRPDRSS